MKQLGVAAVLFLAAMTTTAGCGGKSAPAPTPAEPAPINNTVDAPAEAPPPEETSIVYTDLPECNAYIVAAERFAECDKVPQASRHAVQLGLDGMKATLGNTRDMPPEARTASNDACRQATDAFRQSATAMGCAL